MGMFDSVVMRCDCGGMIEVQSKAGDCLLRSYDAHAVPSRIAVDVNGQYGACDRCGTTKQLRISFVPTPDIIPMEWV